MIVAGIDDIKPNGGNILLTLWKWESGTRDSEIGSMQGESTIKTTTTTSELHLTNVP
jgi:hypothetical protein